ncbi:hypothetical protein ScPMuIL_001662 [Solemya velum]
MKLAVTAVLCLFVIGTATAQGFFGPNWMHQLLGFDPMAMANVPMPTFRFQPNRMFDFNSIQPGSVVDVSDANGRGFVFRSADGNSGGFSFSSGSGNGGGHAFMSTSGGQPGGSQQQMLFT